VNGPRGALAASIALAALAGCGSSIHVVRVTNPDAPVQLNSGDTLKVSLRAQPGVGYDWALARDSNPAVLSYTGMTYVPDHKGLVGGPGRDVLTLIAIQSGTAVLTLHYSFRGKLQATHSLTVGIH
jgi:predicted secreted protein